jgi:hypothetical protein
MRWPSGSRLPLAANVDDRNDAVSSSPVGGIPVSPAKNRGSAGSVPEVPAFSGLITTDDVLGNKDLVNLVGSIG